MLHTKLMPKAVHATRNLIDFGLSDASLQSLSSLSSLELLELGDNRISQLAGLDSFQSLRELWLGRNRVTTISGLARSALGIAALPSNVSHAMCSTTACTEACHTAVTMVLQ